MSTRTLQIVIMLSGRGSNFRAIAEAIDAQKLPARITRVLSDRSDAAGLEIARARSIPISVVPRDAKRQSAEDFHEKLIAAVAAEAPGLIVLAGFMRVLAPSFIAAFRGRIINIHPSLLPAFRGLNAQAQALEAGVKLAGCSVHYVTEDLDGGPMIAQAAVPVLPNDTVETLSSRILEQEHKLYPTVVAAIARQEIRLHPDNRVECSGSFIVEGFALRSLS